MKNFKKIVFFVVAGAALVFGAKSFLWCGETNPSFGKIIILTGTSSTGKSSIRSEVVGMVPGVQCVYVDGYFYDLIAEWIDEQTDGRYNMPRGNPDLIYERMQDIEEELDLPEETGCEFDIRSDALMIQDMKRFATEGSPVLCDTVIESEETMASYREQLSDYDVRFVLVTCVSLDELVNRVASRNVRGLAEGRSFHTPLEQFLKVYKPCGEEGPVRESLGVLSRDDVVAAIARAKALEGAREDDDVTPAERFDELEQQFLDYFGLRDHEQVEIEPILLYDVILDHGRGCDPSECAEQIRDLLAQA